MRLEEHKCSKCVLFLLKGTPTLNILLKMYSKSKLIHLHSKGSKMKGQVLKLHPTECLLATRSVWVTGKQLLGCISHSLKRPHSSTCYWGACLAAGCSGLLNGPQSAGEMGTVGVTEGGWKWDRRSLSGGTIKRAGKTESRADCLSDTGDGVLCDSLLEWHTLNISYRLYNK